MFAGNPYTVGVIWGAIGYQFNCVRYTQLYHLFMQLGHFVKTICHILKTPRLANFGYTNIRFVTPLLIQVL